MVLWLNITIPIFDISFFFIIHYFPFFSLSLPTEISLTSTFLVKLLLCAVLGYTCFLDSICSEYEILQLSTWLIWKLSTASEQTNQIDGQTNQVQNTIELSWYKFKLRVLQFQDVKCNAQGFNHKEKSYKIYTKGTFHYKKSPKHTKKDSNIGNGVTETWGIYRKQSKMTKARTSLSLITLNINGLNSPIKRQIKTCFLKKTG